MAFRCSDSDHFAVSLQEAWDSETNGQMNTRKVSGCQALKPLMTLISLTWGLQPKAQELHMSSALVLYSSSELCWWCACLQDRPQACAVGG